MKKIYILLMAIGVITTSSFAQIPNGGFEDWEPNGDGGMDPTYWQTMNKDDFTNVVQDDGHNSPTSAKMSVEWDNSLEMYVTSMIFFDGYFDISQRYTSVSCYYKGTSVGGDSLTLYVGMYKEDILIGYVIGGTATSSDDWQEFSLNIEYFADGTPTKAYMALHIPPSTGPNYGTFFSVDDLAFSMGSGPNAPTLLSATTNPVGDEIDMHFSETMANPDGTESQFVVTHNGSNLTPADITFAVSNENYRLTLPENIQAGETVTVSYAAGTVTSEEGEPLASFNNFPVTNTVGGGTEGEWTLVESGTFNHLWGVHFPDANNGWAVGEWGTVLHSTNGGSTWSDQIIKTQGHLLSVFATNSSKVYVTGWDSIHSSNNGGDSWTRNYCGTVNNYFLDMFFTDMNHGWYVGQFAYAGFTTDGGETWGGPGYLGFSPCDFTSVHFINNDKGWAVGDCGLAAFTTDGGNTWTGEEAYFNTFAYWKSINFIDANTGWIVGDSGIVLKTTNGGASWERIDTNPNYYLTCMNFIDANRGWAGGLEGLIIKTTDGGLTWIEEESHTSENLHNMHFILSGQGWAVGDNGTILHYNITGTNIPTNTAKDCTLSVFPNPVNNQAIIEFELAENQFVTIQIIDITGKVIEIVVSADLTSGEHQFNLGSQNIPNGVYFCRLILPGQSVSKTFVVNN